MNQNFKFDNMNEDKLIKAIEIYIRENGNKYGIYVIKKLNDHIYRINDNEINVDTNTLGFPDIGKY